MSCFDIEMCDNTVPKPPLPAIITTMNWWITLNIVCFFYISSSELSTQLKCSYSKSLKKTIQIWWWNVCTTLVLACTTPTSLTAVLGSLASGHFRYAVGCHKCSIWQNKVELSLLRTQLFTGHTHCEESKQSRLIFPWTRTHRSLPLWAACEIQRLLFKWDVGQV